MDRADILRSLSKVQALVQMDNDRVWRQKSLIAELEARGPEGDLAVARALLAIFELSLAMHIDNQMRISQELVDFDRDRT